MEYFYEEVPRNHVDKAIRVKVYEAAEFAKKDLKMSAVPIFFVRQLNYLGGNRRHVGAIFQFNVTDFQGLACFMTNRIFLDVDYCTDYTMVTLHEMRHIKMGFRESVAAIEFDASLYSFHAELAMYLGAESNRQAFFKNNVVSIDDLRKQSEQGFQPIEQMDNVLKVSLYK